MRSSTTNDDLREEHPEVQKKSCAEALLQGLLPILETGHPLQKDEDADATPLSLGTWEESASYSYLESSFVTTSKEVSSETTLLAPPPDSSREEMATLDQTWGSQHTVVEASPYPPSLEEVTVTFARTSLAIPWLAVKQRDGPPELRTSQRIFLASKDEIYLRALPETQDSLSRRHVKVEQAESRERLGSIDEDASTASPEASTPESLPTIPSQLKASGALVHCDKDDDDGAMVSPRVLEDQQEVPSMLLQGSFGNLEDQRVEAAHLISSLLVAQAQSLLGSLKENILEKQVEGVVEPKHSEELEAPRRLGEETADCQQSPGQPCKEAKAEDQEEMVEEGGTAEVLPRSKGTEVEDAQLQGSAPNEATPRGREDVT
ncbi:hypothetical protein E2320_000041 [Naja naja]|nr:hypothetical protein E2320_000041 [Naja naja]